MNCSTKQLREAMSSCLKISGRRSTLPVLSHVLIKAESGVLSIRATDFDCELVVNIPCEGELEPCCVPAKRLAGWLQYCTDESVALTKSKSTIVVAGSGRAVFDVLQAKEFPAQVEAGAKTGIPCADLAEGIAFCANLIGDEMASENAISGVHLVSTPKMLRLECTRGYIVCRFERPLLCADTDAIIHGKHCRMLCDALLKEGSTVAISDKRISVAHSGGSVSVALLNSRCPKMDGIFSAKRMHLMTARRSAFASAVSACHAMTTDMRDAVVLNFSQKENLKVEFGDTAASYCPGVIADGRGYYSSTKILELLKAMPDEPLEIGTLGKEAAFALWVRHGDCTAILAALREN